MNESQPLRPLPPTAPKRRTSPERYVETLQAKLSQQVQFAAFEPNAEALWTKVRQTITDFLLQEWQNGALLGTKPEQAFFVKCDRTTMTQNDLDQGRLVCVVGVAPKPAEFVIFSLSQLTAASKRDRT